MRKIIFLLGLMCVLGTSRAVPGEGRLGAAGALPGADAAQQGYTAGKTTEDYMETVLARDHKPLGLKEDIILRNLLKQPAVKWAIRAGIRHGLD